MSVLAGTEFEYDHAFHAGNSADVLKHLVLCAVLEEAARQGPVVYVDTHAGAGLHPLRPTGEWTEGVWRLWRDGVPEGPGFAAWWRLVQEANKGADRPVRYPGSPLLAAKLLGADARLELFETHPDACRELARLFGDDRRVLVRVEDGYAGLPEAVRTATGRVVALVDPPYADKPEWARAADAVARAQFANPAATLLLWYPVKSWTRPRTLVGMLRERLPAGATIDLVTTPLEYKRNRLNGSGLVLTNVSEELRARLCGALPGVARRCATQHGRWSLHAGAWTEPVPRSASGADEGPA